MNAISLNAIPLKQLRNTQMGVIKQNLDQMKSITLKTTLTQKFKKKTN